ncbi:uncharacterized protein LOC108225879 [Daucus carota subsp. sativus]|uniref:uncharacterized protein LOC108225879 n=1 Tax=Daucus carota subsp. sativus TaxID=79200 RepID=UPI0007EFB55A|nr:PREDICTED: uncharacterized protein LOC108225879 [Daucus carota subsp. sativus]
MDQQPNETPPERNQETPEGPPPGFENFNPQMMQMFFNFLQQQAQNNSNNSNQGSTSQPPKPTVTFKAFQAVRPLEFKGTTDPIVARTWLKEIEKAFEIVGVEDEKKTLFATYMLKGEANFWWEARRGLEGTGIITWDRFTKLFLDKYYPKYLENQMELQFLELKQGNLSVAEYETKFSELSRFVPHHVDTDEKRALRFQQGLKPWIQNRVAVFELTNYATLVQKAAIVAKRSELYNRERNDNKRKAPQFERSQGKKLCNQKVKKPFVNKEFRKEGNLRVGNREVREENQRFKPPQSTHLLQERPLLPECKTCGKRHPAPCYQESITCFICGQKGHIASRCQNKAITCYKCGKKGHMAKDCRSVQKESDVPRLPAPPGGNKPTARTFNMSLKDALADNDVISGTLTVNSQDACVLIDSGATKSFISVKFMQKLGIDPIPLAEPMNIEIANQDTIPVDRVCPRCEVMIQK